MDEQNNDREQELYDLAEAQSSNDADCNNCQGATCPVCS
jgi:hypothetical protein